MSQTPPDRAGQPPHPPDPDDHWWWDGNRWRPNAEHPFRSDGPAPDDLRSSPSAPPGAVSFTPDPAPVPNPYVPPRGGDGAEPRLRPGGPTPDELPFTLPPPSRSWWTLRRLALVVVGAAVVLVLGVGVLFLLSVQAYDKERSRASDVEVRTALVDAAREMSAYRVDYEAYPSDLAQLTGYTADPKVDVTLVHVDGADDGTDFCLAAGPHGAAPTQWYSGRAGLTPTACG